MKHILASLLFLFSSKAFCDEQPQGRPRVPYECPALSGSLAAEYLQYDWLCDIHSPETKDKRLHDLNQFKYKYPGCYEELKETAEFKSYQSAMQNKLAESPLDSDKIALLKDSCTHIGEKQAEFNSDVSNAMPAWPSNEKESHEISSSIIPGTPYPNVRAELISKGCTLPKPAAPTKTEYRPNPYFKEISCNDKQICHVTFICTAEKLSVPIQIKESKPFIGPSVKSIP